MAYPVNMQSSHLYSVFFAPRGSARMVDMGMKIAQQYLSPYDKLVGLIGTAGSGKSLMIKGMFPGLELTNDDEGVNIRPLPLLEYEENRFYNAHTYHLDIKFESAFTQMHVLADAIIAAVDSGRRVIVEHFDQIFPFLNGRNANLLIGLGEEILVTRPTLFGPLPSDVSDVVFKSIKYRRMTHSAEDLCEYVLKKYGVDRYEHSDVRRGFILSFSDRPKFDIPSVQHQVEELIASNLPLSFADDDHITIGEQLHHCTGPRMHMQNTGEITNFRLLDDFLEDPISGRFLMVGLVGSASQQKISDLNKIIL